jgi:uncharacterized protein
MLIDKIKEDLKQSMKAMEKVKTSSLRMVMGEIPRLNKKAGELPTDEEIKSIIRKLIKSETTVLETLGDKVEDSEYISILNKYLPKEMTEDEVKKWIDNNIDLEYYNPKIKAMKVIMKELKGKVNGNIVKSILLN